MTEIQKNTSIQQSDDEIDLIALAKQLWAGRKTIIFTTIIFAAMGIIVALQTPNVYVASSTMVPHFSNKNTKLGGLSSLAAMAGFNLDLNTESNEISPYVYPQIVQSVPFQLELMYSKFEVPGKKDSITLFDFYSEKSGFSVLSAIKKYTIGLPGVIIVALKGKKETLVGGGSINSFQLTESQNEVRKTLSESVTLETDDKKGFVVINASFKDAYFAAEVAQTSQNLLQKYITEFKIKKAKAYLEFIEDRCGEKKKDFEKAQANLASYRDKNKNITSSMALTEEAMLENEFELAFSVYSELAKQLEQARIKVKEDTPVFSVIKPVSVPMERAKPNRMLILFIWAFFGGVIGVGWIFGKQFLADIRKKWNEESIVSE